MKKILGFIEIAIGVVGIVDAVANEKDRNFMLIDITFVLTGLRWLAEATAARAER